MNGSAHRVRRGSWTYPEKAGAHHFAGEHHADCHGTRHGNINMHGAGEKLGMNAWGVAWL